MGGKTQKARFPLIKKKELSSFALQMFSFLGSREKEEENEEDVNRKREEEREVTRSLLQNENEKGRRMPILQHPSFLTVLVSPGKQHPANLQRDFSINSFSFS